MQVVISAIGDFGVNTCDLQPSFSTITRAELFLAQSSLRLSQLGRVFRRVAGIANLLAFVSNEQVVNAKVNASGLVDYWQSLRLKLAEHRHEVSPCGIFGDCDCAWLAGRFTTPANIQRFFTLGDKQFAIAVLEPALGELCRLSAVLLFELRVFGATLKEVLKGCLLMSQALLKRYARDFVEPVIFRQTFHLGQLRIGLNIANLLLVLIERICAPSQHRVVNHAHTTKRSGKHLLLLSGRIESVFVCAFNHVSHFNIVRCKNVDLSILNAADPALKVRGFRALFRINR